MVPIYKYSKDFQIIETKLTLKIQKQSYRRAKAVSFVSNWTTVKAFMDCHIVMLVCQCIAYMSSDKWDMNKSIKQHWTIPTELSKSK